MRQHLLLATGILRDTDFPYKAQFFSPIFALCECLQTVHLEHHRHIWLPQPRLHYGQHRASQLTKCAIDPQPSKLVRGTPALAELARESAITQQRLL